MSDLFSTNQDDQIQIDPSKNYLEELVGDGKKFKSVEDLARGKMEADMYVKNLERGRDQLREDYLKVLEEAKEGPKVKDLLDQFASQLNTTNSNNTQSAPDVKPSLEIKDVESLFMKQFQEIELKRRQDQNQALVESKLRDAYGEKYTEVFRQKINEQGLSMEWAKQTALSYPQVLFATLGLDRQQPTETFQNPVTGTQRPQSRSEAAKDWNYFEKLRREDPTVYWNPKTQVEMHQLSANNPKFYG